MDGADHGRSITHILNLNLEFARPPPSRPIRKHHRRRTPIKQPTAILLTTNTMGERLESVETNRRATLPSCLRGPSLFRRRTLSSSLHVKWHESTRFTDDRTPHYKKKVPKTVCLDDDGNLIISSRYKVNENCTLYFNVVSLQKAHLVRQQKLLELSSPIPTTPNHGVDQELCTVVALRSSDPCELTMSNSRKRSRACSEPDANLEHMRIKKTKIAEVDMEEDQESQETHPSIVRQEDRPPCPSTRATSCFSDDSGRPQPRPEPVTPPSLFDSDDSASSSSSRSDTQCAAASVSGDTDTCSDSVEREEEEQPLFTRSDWEDGSDTDVWEWTAGDPQNVTSREEHPFFTLDAWDDDLWDLFLTI